MYKPDIVFLLISVGLFEPGERAQKLAFTNAIEKLNLGYAIGNKRMVVYYTEELQPNDSFEANKEGKTFCCLSVLLDIYWQIYLDFYSPTIWNIMGAENYSVLSIII